MQGFWAHLKTAHFMNKDVLKNLGELLLNNPIMSMFEPNPNNHPPVIYKYRNWKDEHNKDLLRKNELFMAPPSWLNDPFDCRIYENHLKFVNTPELKEKYISESLLKNVEYLQENHITELQAREILSERLSDTLLYQVRAEVIAQEIDDKHIGIACFSEKWDSMLMWSHYANDHKGYCIGFDEKRLRYSQLFGKTKRVEYWNKYPELDPMNKNKKSDELKYFCKSEDWKYEYEIRAMNLFFDYETPEPNRVITLDDNHIKEVILGLNTPEEHRIEIINAAKEKGIEVWQTIKADFEFKIERYKL